MTADFITTIKPREELNYDTGRIFGNFRADVLLPLPVQNLFS
jgi:hypothetical protein